MIKAIVNIHEASGSVHGEAIKMVLPWPVSAASAIIGLCQAYRAHHEGDHDGRERAMVAAGTDAISAIPGVHFAVRGTGLMLHVVRRVKHYFGPPAHGPGPEEETAA
jgi:hypothetical protein